ncbi:Molybdenum cofactor guanylyltransferase [Sporomusa silvacetica DSM 10669]|uniref:Molybdenum cofactor guanylyltransferase n=1 Tax=Sporomusa silvacetica DSM 10669 TaxID=1123289 RepID=A0ABZ3IMB5_9FIRM|nr:NTP transferase domain-containing protein [Sporomusa silvacetica]OZC14363.1 molybdenum cofactor cytidylyltransferase [Sporomusa silvacetica DSM 10669]
MYSSRIIGLIVAAGYSSRMGTFKPLMPLGEKKVIETAVDSLRLGGINDIRVIVGYRAAELYPVLERLPVSIIENPNYASGMFSSIVAGVRALAAEAEAFMMLPGDTPLIRSSSIKELIKKYRQTGAAVVYPTFNGQRGHPPVISDKCFASILNGDGAGGLRHILEQFAADSVVVPVADQGVLMDMDTMDDYQQLAKFYAKRNIPTYDECLALLDKYQTGDKVLRHGQTVAAVAQQLVDLLNGAGLKLNSELVVAGGLLHDLAKGKPNHPRRGGRLVTSNGFSALAGIVAAHMDLELTAEQAIDEAAVLFLADKLVQGDRRVSLNERFNLPLAKFSENPEILAAVLRRQQTAEIIRDRITGLVGIGSLEKLVLR